METAEISNEGYVNPHGSGSETSAPKNPQDCKFFHSCSAGLCPLDPEVSKRIWLPEESDTEEVCRNPEFAGLQFIKTQRKIVKVLRKRPGERDDYFTYSMLNRDITVKSGIRGAPSDPPDSIKDAISWYEKKEKLWLARHHERKKLSMEEVQRRKANMKTLREGRVRK